MSNFILQYNYEKYFTVHVKLVKQERFLFLSLAAFFHLPFQAAEKKKTMRVKICFITGNISNLTAFF